MRRRLGWLAVAALLAAGAPAVVRAATVPASIALRPDCGPPAGPQPATYTIEVIGRGLTPGEADVTFNPGATQQAFAGNIDETGAEDDVIHPNAVPAGTYVVLVQPFAAVEGPPLPSARALFQVPCPPPPIPSPSPSRPPPATASPSPSPSPAGSPPAVLNPVLTLAPPVGPPGTVVVVHGTSFPPTVPIQLSWSQGIPASTASAITTDGAGAFTATVLVYPHDELGARVLTAVSTAPPGSSQFGFASAAFLVVAGQVQPRDFSGRR